MSDVYLIKKATLTTIADAIREVSPNDYPEGTTITPEEVGSTAIYSVYNQGYTDGKAESEKVTDLKGKTYYIPSGWQATAGYGNFMVLCDIVYQAANITKTRFSVGYETNRLGMSSTANYILVDNGSGLGVTDGFSFGNTEAFTITFIDGNTTNASLIDWVTTWGELQSGVDLEALGELCEVVTMVDSAEELYVAIYNRHPTYYLHCSFIHIDFSNGRTDLVIAPNSFQIRTVPNIYQEFKVDNVRWKASAT